MNTTIHVERTLAVIQCQSVMENIPLQVSMEEQTFDHDESDYLLSAPESGGRNAVKRSRRGSRNYGIERYMIYYLLMYLLSIK